MSESPPSVQEAIELQLASVAAEIHDSLCPHLFATRMRLETLLSHFATSADERDSACSSQGDAPVSKPLAELAREELAAAVDSLHGMMNLSRQLMGELYPPDLSIDWQTHLNTCFERVVGQTECRLVLYGDFDRWVINPEHRLTARRIAQEAIRNAARHGKAAVVEVVVQSPRPHVVVMTIRDDGHGFDTSRQSSPARQSSGYGLRIMRMRAKLINAALEIESAQGGPTTVTMTLESQDVAAAD